MTGSAGANDDLARLNRELAAANAELERVNEAMRDFVSIASHDLRSPLTSVLGFAATLVKNWDETPDATRKEFVQIIDRQARRTARLVEDLLTLSKMNSGVLEAFPELVLVSEVFASAVEEAAEGTEVALECSDTIKAMVDPDHIHRMLVNYLSNALKYGKPPFEMVAIQTQAGVEIKVNDCGAGVPSEFEPELFQQFARPAGGNAKGTGLGLSIVKGLAEANGGCVAYEKLQPSGCSFSVTIPTS